MMMMMMPKNAMPTLCISMSGLRNHAPYRSTCVINRRICKVKSRLKWLHSNIGPSRTTKENGCCSVAARSYPRSPETLWWVELEKLMCWVELVLVKRKMEIATNSELIRSNHPTKFVRRCPKKVSNRVEASLSNICSNEIDQNSGRKALEHDTEMDAVWTKQRLPLTRTKSESKCRCE